MTHTIVRTALATSLIALGSATSAASDLGQLSATADSVPLIVLLGLGALCIAAVLVLFRKDENRL